LRCEAAYLCNAVEGDRCAHPGFDQFFGVVYAEVVPPFTERNFQDVIEEVCEMMGR
jgi:hypothetical protein